MITVVPGLRTAPTAGKVPLRTFHRRSISAGSVVKPGASMSGWACSSASTAAMRACSSGAPGARVSMSSAVTPSGRVLSSGGMPGLSATQRREARSSSSTASTGRALRPTTARQALTMSGKKASALALWAYSGTVW